MSQLAVETIQKFLCVPFIYTTTFTNIGPRLKNTGIPLLTVTPCSIVQQNNYNHQNVFTVKLMIMLVYELYERCKPCNIQSLLVYVVHKTYCPVRNGKRKQKRVTQ